MRSFKLKFYQLLRWSEKYTKTDMVYLAKGGSWLTLGQIVSSLSSFLLAIAFANLLPKETYGIYKYILSIAGILAIPTLSGMGTALVQAVARGYEGSFIPVLKTKIHWGLLGGLASVILAGYYFYQDNTTLTISFLIYAVFLPFMDSFSIYDSLLQGRKLFGISAKYGIISQIIAIVTLIATLFFTKNLFLILLAYFTSWTILRFIFLKITLKKFPLKNEKDPQTISYGKHLSLINVFGTIASSLDGILLFHYLGPTSLAIYIFALAPVNQIKGLFKNIPPLAIPKIAPHSLKETDTIIRKRLPQLILAGALIATIYIILIPYVFKIFFPKYLDSIFFSRLYGIIIAFMPINFLLNAVSNAKLVHIPKKWLYQQGIIVQVVLIVSLLLLTPILGITSAVISKIIFSLATTIIWLYYWKKILKINRATSR